MKTIADTITRTTDQAVLTLRGKEVVYYREGASRHMWIGKVVDITMNGATIEYRNGVSQGYSLTYFRNNFLPAHWVANKQAYGAACNMSVNRCLWTEDQKSSQPPACEVSDLGEFYIWRRNGGVPTVQHLTLQQATEEATRLAKANPDDEFLILAVAASVSYKARTTYDLSISIR